MKACLLILALAAPAGAQSPFLRASDTRTSTPESVMGQRKLWGADASFGGSFNRGNTNVDYVSSGFDLFRAWEPCTAYLSGSMIYNAFNGREVLNQGTLTARVDHRIAGPWKVFAFNTQSYNDFIRLNYRTTTGAGPWYDLRLGPTEHGLSLAAVHEYQAFNDGFTQRAGRLSFRDISRVPLSPVAELRGDFYYQPKLDEPSNAHLYAELALQTIFWKDTLGLKVSWIDEYDTRPRPGIKKNDVLWFTALTVRLGK